MIYLILIDLSVWYHTTVKSTLAHAEPYAQHCMYIQAAVLYVRWQILELPNRIIVVVMLL